MRRAFAVMAAVAILAAGCSSAVNVTFGSTPLDDETAKRFRSAKLYRSFDTILIVDAIRLDDALVETWATDYQKSNLRSDEEMAALKENELAPLKDNLVFVVALYAAESEWDDLNKSKSHWTVSLRGGNGPLRAVKVEKNKVKHYFFRDSIPFDHRFRTFYTVSFPKDAVGAPPHRLSLSGLLGSAELVWKR